MGFVYAILFKYQFKIRIYTVFRSLDVIGILDLTRMTSNNFSTYSQNILPLKIFSHNHLIIFHKHFWNFFPQIIQRGDLFNHDKKDHHLSNKWPALCTHLYRKLSNNWHFLILHVCRLECFGLSLIPEPLFPTPLLW